MNDQKTSIHQFEFQLICKYFSLLNRQGPGSLEATLKALSFIENLTSESKIADLGSGTGSQTFTLAQHAPGVFTALDLFQDFVDMLNNQANSLNLQHRVKAIVGSMDNLPFQTEELDLIWSEGAIYNIGFEKGINLWRPYLKTGGYLAVTEASWFTLERPQEIHNFWMDAYPEIDTISKKVEQMQRAGYLPVATFILPENCWIENFYLPQQIIQDEFLKKYKGNPTVEAFIENMRYEAKMYSTYKDYYGYVFYIGKKI